MCALYVRRALSVLQKECRKAWGARYALGARYRSENMVIQSVLNLGITDVSGPFHPRRKITTL